VHSRSAKAWTGPSFTVLSCGTDNYGNESAMLAAALGRTGDNAKWSLEVMSEATELWCQVPT
jgi:hypothetical protein